MNSKWSFQERSKKSVNRDPFEAEFFAGEEEDEEVYGRTDALVREAIQNSLDAQGAGHEGPVRIRFKLSGVEEAVPDVDAAALLDGLVPHLDVLGNEYVNKSSNVPPMPYLLIEDFGTRGLCGDPAWNGITVPDDGQRYDFYWFWRNVGRSGKSGTDRGRWGLGKTVFPAASRINTFFGLTVRCDDHKKLLMGQSITKLHELEDKHFVPEGFYCDPGGSGDLQMPFDGDEVVAAFYEAFDLERADNPGLSVVVPYPFERLSAKELLRSVVVHFFLPIVCGRLIVEVSGPDLEPEIITSETIEQVASELTWDGSPKEKKHASPPFKLAEWAVKQQEQNAVVKLKNPQDNKAPMWGEHCFEPAVLDELRAAFDSGNRLAIRVPMTVQLKTDGGQQTYFDVFIERDSDLVRSDDHFVREGMTISKISTLAGVRGVRGLVIVEDKLLSALLGDAEGPAHTEWSTGESRPDQTYVKWKSRISFVRNSIAKLLGLLAPPPEKLDEDWLQDIFSVSDPETAGSKKKKMKRKRKNSSPPPPPPRETKAFHDA